MNGRKVFENYVNGTSISNCWHKAILILIHRSGHKLGEQKRLHDLKKLLMLSPIFPRKEYVYNKISFKYLEGKAFSAAVEG